MAKSGSKKALATEHERAIAKAYDGHRSRSSGGHVTDEGDVRVEADDTLFEGKGQFGERLGKKPVRSTLLKQFHKITDEAYSINLRPALALRFYAPESILADQDGYVDLVVRLMDDDSYRSLQLDRCRKRTCEEEGRWHSG